MTMIVPYPYRLKSAIILCGGQGTRFRAVSDKIPKILASVGGKRLIDVMFDNLVRQDFVRVVLATGHLSDVVEAYVNEREDIDISISYEERPLGTGGAVKKASRLIDDENVLVLNGDTVIEFDVKKMLEFHYQHSADFTMCLTSKNPDGEYGRVRLNPDKTIAELRSESPNPYQYTNAGVYIIKRKLLSQAQIDRSSLEDEDLPSWINKKRLVGYVIHEPLFDIGTPERYQLFLDAFDKG